jgi:Spy/CpxP family protein refolding chaperone
LDLTQEQKDQLKSLRTANQKKMIQLRADAQIAGVELRELMHEKDPNKRQVDAAVAKVNSARGKMMSSRVHQKLAVNKILTDEQLQKLEEMPGRRGGRERHFRNHPGPKRMGPQGRGMGGQPAPFSKGSDSRI